MREIKAPNKFTSYNDEFSVFLAGSIEMGTAELWQDKMVDALSDLTGIILNPRRDDWDATWVQDITNDAFREQVEWELHGLETVDLAMFCFDPNTKSPITLLELGLFHKKALVCCPIGFWRKGNVDIVCRHYGVPQVETINDLIKELRHRRGN